MAAPHKGDRELIGARPLRPVYEAVKNNAADRGISISQYVADVLAVHVGRPDLVRALGQEVLPVSA
jgi:predicted DNA binding CopG/RHH family protein